MAATGAWAAPDGSDRLAIVDRAIEHHGGDLYERSRTTLQLCSRSGCYDVESAIWRGWYSHTVERDRDDGRLSVQATNDWVRRWRDGEPVPVPPEEEQRLRDFVMERVYFAFLPYRLNDPSARRWDQGVEEWEGRRLHRVKVTFEPGSSTDAQDEFVYWFDLESGRLEQFAYTYDRGEGGLRFRRAVDHRRVGGILFFDQENLGVDGDGLSVDALDPDYVRDRLEPISRVVLREVGVEPLEAPPYFVEPGRRRSRAEAPETR